MAASPGPTHKIRLAYLVTHPIQYQTPLLRRVAALPNIQFKAFFQSDISTRSHVDPGFGHEIAWDVPLLEGYDHAFLPILFGSADQVTVWSPFSRGLIRALLGGGFDALWIFGYNRPYNILVVWAALSLGIKVILRDEPHAKGGRQRAIVEFFKKAYISAFSACGGVYLAIGSQNAEYFRQLGMAKDRIFIGPYSVDNSFFQQKVAQAAARREALRAELGLRSTAPVILYASKFIRRKHPDDLLAAYADVLQRFDDTGAQRPYLLFAGSGEMYEEVKGAAQSQGLERVRFVGFKNQTELPALYELCDVFVLPSSDENWGLVINEAMNAGCAVIATEEVGCHTDLIHPGENGFVIPVGDRAALSRRLYDILGEPSRAAEMGRRSLEIVNHWGYDELIAALVQALNKLFTPRENSRS